MRRLPIAILCVAALGLTACGSDKGKEAETAESADWSGGEKRTEVEVNASSDDGHVELKLPGGFEAKVKAPGMVEGKGHFDIDGVGMYPGGKINTVNVKATTEGKKGRALVNIGFSAPADAAAVADWYEKGFAEKKVAATRNGETFTGKTEDGDDFTLALTPADGGSRGLLTIRDED